MEKNDQVEKPKEYQKINDLQNKLGVDVRHHVDRKLSFTPL